MGSLIIIVICFIIMFIINFYIVISSKNRIIDDIYSIEKKQKKEKNYNESVKSNEQNLKNVKVESKLNKIKNEKFDCIIILGAGIWNGKPSPMLEDRLRTGVRLYKNGLAPKIIMSGDHGSIYHDEVNLMKNYAKSLNVPSEDIFMDHAGFSTYDSMYRAKEIFDVKNTIIVTQKYHLYRAIYIAKKLGINAYGVSANLRDYVSEKSGKFREFFARNKEFFKCIVKPKSKIIGKKISLNQSGDITND